MSREARLYLEDIQTSCAKIERYVQGMDREEFIADEVVFDAVIRNLIIIGEAARQVSEETKSRYSDVAWRKIVGLRNIVTHVYFGIDEDIIWDLVQHYVPDLRMRVARILEAEFGNEGSL